MNASKTPTPDQIERLSQNVQDIMTKYVADNSALIMIALARKFGFRGKRLTDLMYEYNAVREEYEAHRDDDVFDIRISEELKAIGIDPEQIYLKTEDIMKQIQKNKKKRQYRQLTLKEQYEMKRFLDEMRNEGKYYGKQSI